jgi:hypothetical protein
VRTSPGSPYLVSIYSGNRPLPLRLEEGQPVVDLRKGQTFVLRIANNASHDVSAAVTLDGVSSFAFSQQTGPDGNALQRYVLFARKFQWIKGWYDTSRTVKEFKVEAFQSRPGPGQSPAAQFGTESSLGMITVVIRGSWAPGASPPADEPGQQLVEGAVTPTFSAPETVTSSALPQFPEGRSAALPGSPAETDGATLAGSAFPSGGIVAGSAPTFSAPSEFQTRGVPLNEPGAAEPKSPDERLAIDRGQTRASNSQPISGRGVGVVRSIITIRYDK